MLQLYLIDSLYCIKFICIYYMKFFEIATLFVSSKMRQTLRINWWIIVPICCSKTKRSHALLG
jgi:hypothetical protein